MQPAAVEMEAALAEAEMTEPVAGLVANVTACPVRRVDSIKAQLVEQVTGRVRWRESVQFMAGAGVTRFVEVGAGKVLSGMVKRIAPEAETLALNTQEDLESFARSI
jgi:[acyl-carrier-protein] S-malonyltransferase